ncbi:hypothetical protein F3Y22_tig00110940pilonHSYRG00519 [Hibiscus syriacus]|uniref:Uncharacterized protein n=1 Tax=Hibiscus syriacus TaxID=106335 RepID=A0A6A2ZCD4_HIBSY|nr:hypothetical protein F3Y22_tig00110940pilonHSYRG00519 [Hibiscus syriacus]
MDHQINHLPSDSVPPSLQSSLSSSSSLSFSSSTKIPFPLRFTGVLPFSSSSASSSSYSSSSSSSLLRSPLQDLGSRDRDQK